MSKNREPESVTQADVNAALRVLRIDLRDLVSIDVRPGVITVHRRRLNAAGNAFIAGKEPAEVTTTIAILDQPPRVPTVPGKYGPVEVPG